jgi:hypothetical protein
LSALRAALQALPGLTLCASCAAKPAPVPVARPALVQAPASPSGGGERASCPRVERALRMWTGFLVDVPSEALVRALDVVVPIQVALGELFCAPAHADCRPSELQAIDLTDEHANVAHVRVHLARTDGMRELPLTFQVQNEAWIAQPKSLAQYLALCRVDPESKGAGPRASQTSKRAGPRASNTTTKAAPE